MEGHFFLLEPPSSISSTDCFDLVSFKEVSSGKPESRLEKAHLSLYLAGDNHMKGRLTDGLVTRCGGDSGSWVS